MTDIRRYYIPQSTVFITAVCHKRRPILDTANEKNHLLNVLREVKDEMGFSMLAYVILDDHFHCLIRPSDARCFSDIMQSVKLRYLRRYKRRHGISDPVTLWQRRFWDHLIRDEGDFNRHMDYIHYNPVKHGYVTATSDYSWSSFQTQVERGRYPADWACSGMPLNLHDMALE